MGNQPIPDNFFPESGMQELFLCPGKKAGCFLCEEQVCQHINSETSIRLHWIFVAHSPQSAEAKEIKGNPRVAWLDLANAWGTIPHGLINKAMEHYHIPHYITGMMTKYFGGFKLCLQTFHFTTKWQDLEKGPHLNSINPCTNKVDSEGT